MTFEMVVWVVWRRRHIIGRSTLHMTTWRRSKVQLIGWACWRHRPITWLQGHISRIINFRTGTRGYDLCCVTWITASVNGRIIRRRRNNSRMGHWIGLLWCAGRIALRYINWSCNSSGRCRRPRIGIFRHLGPVFCNWSYHSVVFLGQ